MGLDIGYWEVPVGAASELDPASRGCYNGNYKL